MPAPRRICSSVLSDSVVALAGCCLMNRLTKCTQVTFKAESGSVVTAQAAESKTQRASPLRDVHTSDNGAFPPPTVMRAMV